MAVSRIAVPVIRAFPSCVRTLPLHSADRNASIGLCSVHVKMPPSIGNEFVCKEE